EDNPGSPHFPLGRLGAIAHCFELPTLGGFKQQGADWASHFAFHAKIPVLYTYLASGTLGGAVAASAEKLDINVGIAIIVVSGALFLAEYVRSQKD
ncbi:MAG: hypothetical protein ACKV19_20265, partial [Verrucomicrobiales bacterium]